MGSVLEKPAGTKEKRAWGAGKLRLPVLWGEGYYERLAEGTARALH